MLLLTFLGLGKVSPFYEITDMLDSTEQPL